MDSIHLSPRLEAVAKHVPQGAIIADIGSDHAYLPAHLLLTYHVRHAIAGEVAQGPFENVQHEINRRHLNGKLEARLANGLAAIDIADKVDTVVIAGMGGILIQDILSAGQSKKHQYNTLILQPNTDENVVRSWLNNNHYLIIAEDIVQEGSHFYEVIVATPGESKLSEREIDFGPYLLQSKSPIFVAKWQKECDRIQLILEHLKNSGNQNTVAYKKWQTTYDRIKELIS